MDVCMHACMYGNVDVDVDGMWCNVMYGNVMYGNVM